jgi:HSP90 family molecular chaperone
MGPIVKRRIKMFMKEFEKIYAKELANFDGFVSAFRETTDLLEKHLKVEYLYPLKIDLKRMRLTTISKYEKIIAKNYIQHLKQSSNDVYYVTELIQIILENSKANVPREELLKILIKYLENNILIPLPPPPSETM